MSESEELLSRLARNLYEGDAKGVAELTGQALDQGMEAGVVLNQGLMAGMDEIGRDFREGEIFIPEVIVAARAMHAGIDLLRPLLAATEQAGRGKIVIGTVKGDMHDIGKKIVGVMMQGAGFGVLDLGHDVAPERFVEAVRNERPDFVGLSALLSTTMPMMKTTLEALRGAPDAQVKVLIGGAPVTQDYADRIGADGYAQDAVGAVALARELMGE